MANRDVSWVRTEILVPSPPPDNRRGGLDWVRRNLFGGWTSTLLTLGSIVILLSAIRVTAPWLLGSVWNAHSLGECRQILDGAPGACWAVIRDRWTQLLFGFYPKALYWRPVLSFGLMVVALAPVLFTRVPRKLLWFSAIFPGLGYWLIWGGTVWFPVAVYAGPIICALLSKVLMRLSSSLGGLAAVAGAVAWWLLAVRPFAAAMDRLAPIALDPVASQDLGGFLLSVIIGVTGIALSLPLGILLALGRRSDMPLIRTLSIVFIEFIRGVPLITLLFTASLLLNYFLPPGTSFDLILRVVIMVTLFATAYMAEVVRGGLAALPRGQYEAAEALGLNYWQAQRLIIMPQALKISIPGIVNSFIGLFKDTTLVVFIGLLDPIALSNAIRANTDWQGIYWELYIFIGALFFLFCFSMSRYSMHLERRLKTDNH